MLYTQRLLHTMWFVGTF